MSCKFFIPNTDLKIAAHISEFCDVAPRMGSSSRDNKCGMPKPGQLLREPIEGELKYPEDQYKNEHNDCTTTGLTGLEEFKHEYEEFKQNEDVYIYDNFPGPKSGGICCARCRRITELPLVQQGKNKGLPNPWACPLEARREYMNDDSLPSICPRVKEWAEGTREQLGLGEQGLEEVDWTEEVEELRKKYPGLVEQDEALFQHLKSLGHDVFNFPASEKNKVIPFGDLEGKSKEEVEQYMREYFRKFIPYHSPEWYMQKYPGIENEPSFSEDFEEYQTLSEVLQDAIKDKDTPRQQEIKEEMKKWKPISWHLEKFKQIPAFDSEAFKSFMVDLEQ